MLSVCADGIVSYMRKQSGASAVKVTSVEDVKVPSKHEPECYYLALLSLLYLITCTIPILFCFCCKRMKCGEG